MDLVNMHLTLLHFLFDVSIEFLLVHDPAESLLYFLACLHNLSFNETIVNPPILLHFLKNRVLLVDSVQVSIFNVSEGALPIAKHVLVCLDLFLLNVNYLANVENVFNSCLNITD
jgi:hypothetical protein